MSDPFIAEIRIWANTYNPLGWSFCDGTPLSVMQNQALYAVIGVSFGGTPGSVFNLPNLKNRAPMGKGTGSGLTPRTIAQSFGEMTHTLTVSEMTAHVHTLYADVEIAKETVPDPPALHALAYTPTTKKAYKTYKTGMTPPTLVGMNPIALTPAGGGVAHNNMQPYIAMNYCIAVEGVYPVPS